MFPQVLEYRDVLLALNVSVADDLELHCRESIGAEQRGLTDALHCFAKQCGRTVAKEHVLQNIGCFREGGTGAIVRGLCEPPAVLLAPRPEVSPSSCVFE